MILTNTRLMKLFVSVMLVMLASGCEHRFAKRCRNTLSAFSASINKQDTKVFDYWCLSRGISHLQNSKEAVRTNGVIYYAVYSVDWDNKKRVDIGYLSNDAHVHKILVMNHGVTVRIEDPICCEVWRPCEKYIVGFSETCRWDATVDPIKECSQKESSIAILKDNGCVIGPVPILKEEDVWKEICEKILFDREWQNKYLKLYQELCANPNMGPKWGCKGEPLRAATKGFRINTENLAPPVP